MQKIIYLIFLFSLSLSLQTQTINTVTVLETKNQECLDEGKYMLGCARTFYLQMDSVLNVAYNRLRRSLDESEKAKLKNSQILWLTQRDAYFDKLYKELQKKYAIGMAGQDEEMFVYEDQAAFVKKRVLELMLLLQRK